MKLGVLLIVLVLALGLLAPAAAYAASGTAPVEDVAAASIEITAPDTALSAGKKDVSGQNLMTALIVVVLVAMLACFALLIVIVRRKKGDR